MSDDPKPTNQYRWDRCAPWLAAALARDARGFSIDQVRRDFEAGRYFLLDTVSAAALCEPIDGPTGRHCHVYLAGGDFAQIVSVLLPRLEICAAHLGCRTVFATGRKGWTRTMPRYGFKTLGRTPAGEWLVAKAIKPDSLEKRTKSMTAINYSLSHDFVALATDTLVQDGRNWWPAFLTPKAAFLPRIDGLITCNGLLSVLCDAYNAALQSPAANVDDLAPALASVCRRSFGEALTLLRCMHPSDGTLSWTEDCAVTLFGWSPTRSRFAGYRFGVTDDFVPTPLADGVYTYPPISNGVAEVTPENVLDLCTLIELQREMEAIENPNEPPSIGGEMLLWELCSDPSGAIVSRVQRVSSFENALEAGAGDMAS